VFEHRHGAVLRCFNAKQRGLGITELADHLGVTRATTHRHVVMLVALGYLEQDSARKYRLTQLGLDTHASVNR
jgi:DNA-binding IclR family transcriptional regulator